ncbi:hypothetical protein ACFLXD_04665 [Chloroflexota bacterium]
MPNIWKRVDIQNTTENVPVYLQTDDECYYARDYVPYGGWAASVANSLMENFKKEAAKQGTAEWRYKESAIKQLANELTTILPPNALLCAIPPSKLKTEPDYDPRFDMLFAELYSIGWKGEIVEPITCNHSLPAAHLGGTRDPLSLKDNYSWNGFGDECPEVIYILDDVLTSGGHFRTCKDMILVHCPETNVIGIFFCKTNHDQG